MIKPTSRLGPIQIRITQKMHRIKFNMNILCIALVLPICTDKGADQMRGYQTKYLRVFLSPFSMPKTTFFMMRLFDIFARGDYDNRYARLPFEIM